MEKKTLKLNQIIQLLNGLNIISNAGVSIKDVEAAFNMSLYKHEAQKLFDAFQEASKGMDEKKDNKKELEALLNKEYEIEVPTLNLELFKGSKVEIPLIAFDYLREFISK